MRRGDTIFNLDGLPFRSEQLALCLRDLLITETGKSYRLTSTSEGGFVLHQESSFADMQDVVTQGPPELELHKRSDHLLGNTKPTTLTNSKYPCSVRDYSLRPAVFRTHVLSLVLLGGAVMLVLIPAPLLAGLLGGLNFTPEHLGFWWQRCLDTMTVIGTVSVLSICLALLWQRASARYRVTAFGVEASLGILAQQTVGLRFQDIRSMTIRQTLPERLLNVGLLEFTSAGTEGAPVRFDQIAHPAKILALVKKRMGGSISAD